MNLKKEFHKLTDDQLAIAGLGGGLILGVFGLGFGMGALSRYLLAKVRGEDRVALMGDGMFSGEDPIVEAAKRL